MSSMAKQALRSVRRGAPQRLPFNSLPHLTRSVASHDDSLPASQSESAKQLSTAPVLFCLCSFMLFCANLRHFFPSHRLLRFAFRGSLAFVRSENEKIGITWQTRDETGGSPNLRHCDASGALDHRFLDTVTERERCARERSARRAFVGIEQRREVGARAGRRIGCDGKNRVR
jgi:hypothetical protein